jgi:hypothetical protein
MLKFKRSPKSKPVTVALCGTRIPSAAFDMIGDVPVLYRKRPHIDPQLKRLSKELQGMQIVEGG